MRCFVRASRSVTQRSLPFQLCHHRHRLLGIIHNTGPAQRAGRVHSEPCIAARDVEDMAAVGQPSEILPFAVLKLAYRALGDLSPAPICDRLLVLERRHATDDGRGQTSTASLARRLRSGPVLVRIRKPSSLSPRRGHTSRGKALLLDEDDEDDAGEAEEADGSCGEVLTGGCPEYHTGRLLGGGGGG